MRVSLLKSDYSKCDCCDAHSVAIKGVGINPKTTATIRSVRYRLIYTCEDRCWPQFRHLLMQALLRAEI